MEYRLGILGVVIWLLVMKLLKKKEGTKDGVSRNSASRSANRWHTEKLPGAGSSRRPVRASDGHILSEMRDITCRQFGHNHSKWEQPAAKKCGYRKRTNMRTVSDHMRSCLSWQLLL